MISVCMATYNGEKYIRKQLETILSNLSEEDEVVVSDDGSSDNTRLVIQEFQDKRVRVIDGPRKGVVANFENAIRSSKGDIIFLADQDDIWTEDKVRKVVACFDVPDCMVVLHDATVIDGNEVPIIDSFFENRGTKTGVLKNIIKNSYIGCCMAFRKELKEYILPIPNNCGLHDQWIGIWGELKGKATLIKEPLLLYRRHGENVSGMEHLPVKKMLLNRTRFIKELIKRKYATRK